MTSAVTHRKEQDAAVEECDVVLVGGGVMSATLAALLGEVEPGWRVAVVERLEQAGLESSDAWNNAGTGHAGLCEFNYTPRRPDGTVDVSSAIDIGKQFLVSLQFWAALVERGEIGPPETFIRSVPHMGFGRGDAGVEYLRLRWEGLRDHYLFRDLEFTDDRERIASWLPLMSPQPRNEPVAMTRSESGTDVDFGVLTRQLLASLSRRGGDVLLGHEVTRLRRVASRWRVEVRDRRTGRRRRLVAPFVFLGAGGGTLPLLQSARVPEIRRHAVFPISGQFLRTSKPELVARHNAKVYGHAEPGSPPISVPHLDRRVVEGQDHLLFGPFAAFSPRFLRRGRMSDLIRSIRPGNVGVLWATARDNGALITYLLRQVAQTPSARMRALRRFVPEARSEDWELVTAGQRVQILQKADGRGAMVNFGTQIVSSAGGSLVALLGASPGASTAAATMLEVLTTSFPDRSESWEQRLRGLVPVRGGSDDTGLQELADVVSRVRAVLQLTPVVPRAR